MGYRRLEQRSSFVISPNDVRWASFLIRILVSTSISSQLGFGALFTTLKGSGNGTSKITLRKRLHVNTLITEPGTIEIDWNNAYSLSTSNFAMPSAIKYTPEGSSIIW